MKNLSNNIDLTKSTKRIKGKRISASDIYYNSFVDDVRFHMDDLQK